MSPPRSKRSSFEFLGRRRRTSSASISSPETAPGGMLVVNESWTHIAEGGFGGCSFEEHI